MTICAAVLTTSDQGARGERDDTSGAIIQELLASLGAEIVRYEVIPDDAERIADHLCRWADGGKVQLIVTTGGTGLGLRDFTPQATQAVLDYEIPGIAEAMRAEGLKHTPMAMISRAVVGVRGKTIIVNLPGNPKGVRENLTVVLPVLQHAVELLSGEYSDHG
ncbi:MAG TPA: MogA/MoaB family molybdenum cofactor biosynthesis protein [Dehalococcoidia bacterium]|nr:MogA/MoaB family molybdenum cofactor biosynthesis protein [Dehalococcoidia bacterium]